MTTYRVVFPAEAEDDLVVIYEQIAMASGEVRANSVVGRLQAGCLSLDVFPHRGTPRDDLLPGLRTIGYRSWATFASTIKNRIVTIEGVFWRGRDLDAALDRSR